LYSFTKNERWALAGTLLLLLPALLLNLGIVPLYAEEPRRATVALEMLLRGNWLVPTINGEFYQLKPPVFNWLLASMYSLNGSPTEFITRIPSIISLLSLGLVIFLVGKKYVSFSFGALSALLFVTAAGNLFFNALLAEIDLFYSLITYTSLISLFHFYQQKKYTALFLVVYLLGAVGTLTKGLPSLVFTGLSLLAFFIVNKDFRKLFSLSHFTGILLYVILVGSYFFIYSKHGDAITYLLNLSVESGKRFSGDTFWDYLSHMALYPLDTLMNLLPASILIIFVFRKSFFKDIRENAFLKFALLMLIVHFPVYWLPPGGRQRYIIMLYPFIIQVLAYFFLVYFEKEKKLFRALSIIITIAIGLGALGSLVPLFTVQTVGLSLLIPVCLATFLVMSVLFFITMKNARFAIFSLLFALLALRFLFGFVVLPVRAAEGRAPENKAAAIEIAGITQGQQVCILNPTYFPMQSVFYYEKERNEILPLCNEVKPGSFYIIERYILQDYIVYRESPAGGTLPPRKYSEPYSGNDREVIPGNSYSVYKEFTLQKREYLLLIPTHRHLSQTTQVLQQ
jgi:4-amino-4-deoxy-L-arabinose transferase-like glycosyltransferase